MKVVIASTPEQQKYVKDLVENLYDRIFPHFFSQDYIQSLKEFKLLNTAHITDLSLMEIMEVTAAIQMISTILEQLIKNKELEYDYQSTFNKNANILSKHQIDFPFKLNDFKVETNLKVHQINNQTFYM